ncbi:MAG: acyltransferase family protein, partial [Proteobacteria bacterium]|nr:acyltransferase family protein [Pseudomonadota bacterium]
PFVDPANDPLDLEYAKRWAPYIRACSKYFRPSFIGLENIPHQGAALMVGNHGIMGFDPFVLFWEIYRVTGRLPRGLGEHMLFVYPPMRDMWHRLGSLDGTKENALAFLKAGHLVNTYPGGARAALKAPDRRYALHWDESQGFIKVAMAAQVPIIFHAGIGVDDTYHILGKIRWTGRVMGHRKYEVPILLGWGGFPRPVKFTYYVSEPIHLEGGPDDIDDADIVERNHRHVWELGQRMLDRGVRRRRSIWYG